MSTCRHRSFFMQNWSGFFSVTLIVLALLVPTGHAQVVEALKEAAGLTGLTRWADVQSIDGRGLCHITLSYNDYKLQYSHRIEVEKGSEADVPHGYAGDWRIYRGDGYVFLATREDGKVHHVFQDGSRVPFLELFRKYLEGQHALPTASGERTLTLTIDPETIARLEERRGNAGANSGNLGGQAGNFDEVIVWSLDSGVDEAEDIDSCEKLQDLRAGTGDYDAFTGEIGPGGSVLGTGPVSNPRLNPTWARRQRKYLYRVQIQQSSDPVTRSFWMLVVDGVPQPRQHFLRYAFGRYVVYGRLGEPSAGNPFLAISLSSLDRDEVAMVSSWGQRILDLGSRAWDSVRPGDGGASFGQD